MLTIVLISFPMAIVFHSFYPIDDDFKQSIWTPSFFLVNGASITLTLGITSTLKLFRIWYKEENDNRLLEKLNTETELKFLKNQINPHFLFNSLNNLYALTLKKSDLAPEIVLKLSNLLRYLLYESTTEKVPLRKEIDYLNDYIELERLRVGNRAEIEFNYTGDIDDKTIEPFLFISFVENSFKHGLSNNISEGWVKLNLTVTDNKLSFVISNSVPVVNDITKAVHKGGIGLDNTRKRLNLLYPEKHSLSIFEDEKIYQVELNLILQP